MAPLQGNPNPWRLKKAPGDDGKRLNGDNIAIYIPPKGTQLPNPAPKYTTSIQSYPGVHVKEVGVVIPVADDPKARSVVLLDPTTHMSTEKPTLSYNSCCPPQREVFKSKVFFGRTKGYFGGFVDDVLACKGQPAPGATTWASSLQSQVTPSGMPKPFHPQVGFMTQYIDDALRIEKRNPFRA